MQGTRHCRQKMAANDNMQQSGKTLIKAGCFVCYVGIYCSGISIHSFFFFFKPTAFCSVAFLTLSTKLGGAHARQSHF